MAAIIAAMCWTLAELFIILQANAPDASTAAKFGISGWDAPGWFSEANAAAWHGFMNESFYGPVRWHSDRLMLCPSAGSMTMSALRFSGEGNISTGCRQVDEIALEAMAGRMTKDGFASLISGGICPQ